MSPHRGRGTRRRDEACRGHAVERAASVRPPVQTPPTVKPGTNASSFRAKKKGLQQLVAGGALAPKRRVAASAGKCRRAPRSPARTNSAYSTSSSRSPAQRARRPFGAKRPAFTPGYTRRNRRGA